jgi:hypothetical protein
MGIKIASTLLEENKHDPEQKLWQAVLVNAFEDVVCNASDKKSAIAKWQANEWFRQSNEKDFEFICYMSGFEPEYVKERYAIALRDKIIKFNERQIAWGKYYNVLMEYHAAETREIKRELKLKLEKVRQNVFKTKFEE